MLVEVMLCCVHFTVRIRGGYGARMRGCADEWVGGWVGG